MTDKSDKRERIMEIAKKHFMEKGYYKTSIEDIANDLGVAKGTFIYWDYRKWSKINYWENEKCERFKFRARLYNEFIP